MEKNQKNILITGLPGIGKTTLVKQVWYRLEGYKPEGFYTEEITYKGERKGFQLISLGGEKSMLAHVLIDSPYQIGKYKVDINSLDSFLDLLNLNESKARIIIIDEIGKMECLSNKFVRMVSEILDSNKVIIATIAHTDGGIKGRIKAREDVKLFKMNLENRDKLEDEILEFLESLPQLSKT